MNYEILGNIIRKMSVVDGFYVYLSALDVKWDKWQIEACVSFLTSQGGRINWNWCRGAGKTEKASILAVFYTLRGLYPYWFAASSKQLQQAQVHWQNNPFVEDFRVTNTRTTLRTVGGVIGMSCLTNMSNASGPHPGVAFWDEVALVPREVFVKSLKVLNHDPTANGLFFSTPVLESIFHDLVRKWGQVKHDYRDCSWMDQEQIEGEKIRGLEWLWRQENGCEFIAAEGAVFPADHVIVEDSSKWPKFNRNQKRQGVDFGGSKKGHNLCRIAITEKAIYVLKEENYQYKLDDELLQEACSRYATEIESGGWNETFAPNLKNVSREPFTRESKANKIRMLLEKPIHVDKILTPFTLKELRQAVWEDDNKVDTNHLDYLSALMHAAKNTNSGVGAIVHHDTSERYINAGLF